jgi:hypothetical protein
MTHIEDKRAEEEHQAVIAAISWFKFRVRLGNLPTSLENLTFNLLESLKKVQNSDHQPYFWGTKPCHKEGQSVTTIIIQYPKAIRRFRN